MMLVAGRTVLLTTLLCAYRSFAFAQGCATCYTTAAAGGSQTIHALRSGILLLLFPPVVIFCGVVTLVWRWNSKAAGGPMEKV